VRQLKKLSGHSAQKLYRIINYWLSQQPPDISRNILTRARYLLFDGTYFGKHGCLVIFIDVIHKKILHSQYTQREGYEPTYHSALYLKEQGVHPVAITLDGHKAVTAAITDVWPKMFTQRCLFHIQRQGLSWIRTYPRTEAGRQLKQLLLGIMAIHTHAQKDDFINTFRCWHKKFKTFIRGLPRNSIANKDLKRTMALITHALPEMFYYLDDSKIAPTTNFVEGFYSQLKHHYQRHKGLTKDHQQSYLRWYCYFQNQ